MPQQLSPFLEGKYGWNYGESGWNTGMDENINKFSFMFDRNIDSIVASLPPAVNGQAHYNTADNRIYFAVGSTYYSTPVPKWFVVQLRSSGQAYQFNGTSLSPLDSVSTLDTRLDAVELTVSQLGSAAFQDVSAFATQTALDVAVGQAQAYTDTLRSDISAELETLNERVSGFIHASEFDLLGDGSDETAKVQAAVTAASLQQKVLIGDRSKTYKITSQITGASNCYIRDFNIDASAMTGTKHALVFQGALGSSSDLTADVTSNTFSIPVADGSIFAADEWLLLTVDTSYYQYSAYNVARGEWVQVRSVSGNTVNITTPLVQGYTTATGARLRKCAFVENVFLENVTINGSGVANSNERGLSFRFAKDFKVVGCNFINLDQYALEVSCSIKFWLSKNNFRGTFYNGTLGTIFYAIVLLDACQYFVVGENQGSRSRHLVVNTAASAGQGRWGQCMFGVIHDNVSEDSMSGGGGRSYAYEMHGTGQHLTWANNIANGCFAFMRIEGGSDSQVIGGGCNGYGFQGLIIGGAGNLVRNIDVRGVRLHNYTAEVAGGSGIRFQTSAIMENVTLDGVTVTGAAVSNVGNALSIGTSTTSINNRIKNLQASAGSVEATVYAVAVSANVTGFTFDNCDLFGWRGGYSFPATSSKITVRGGSVENFATGVNGFGFYSNGERNICKGVHFRNINTAIRLDTASANNLAVENTFTDVTVTNPSNAGTANVVTPNYTV